MTTLGIITLLFLFAESGEAVVKWRTEFVALFCETMMLLFVEIGGREAGNLKALSKMCNFLML